MHRKRYCGHLAQTVLQQNGCLFIGPGGGGLPLAEDVGGRFLHKAAHDGKCIHANIQHGTARQVHIEKAVLHVVFFVAAKVQHHDLHFAQCAALHDLPQLFVKRHVPDGHGFRHNQVVGIGQGGHAFQLSAVQRDGFFHQDMLAVGQSLFHKLEVGVVWAGNVDDVHIFIQEHIINAVVHHFNTVLFREGNSFGVGAVANGIQLFAHLLQSLCHLVGNHTGAKHSPVQVIFHGGTLLWRFSNCRAARAVIYLAPLYRAGGRFAMGRRSAADTKNPCRSKQQERKV